MGIVKYISTAVILLLVGCTNPYYSGPTSDHFDGQRFYNHNTVKQDRGFIDVVKWTIARSSPVWPHSSEQKTPKLKLLKRVYGNKASATYIHHATTLIQVDGINILTDPVWSDRASPVSWAGPERAQKMPISLEDLPPIDIILISHNHYDHLNIETLEKLIKLYKPKILTGLGLDSFLRKKGINATAMDWWDKTNVTSKVNITYTPSQHWSSRWGWDRNYTLWGSFIVDTKDIGQIYFGADTGYYQKYFKEIRAKFPNIKLSFLPIGAYKPRWFMEYAHINPQEAVKVAIDLGSQQNIAIQHDTFNLADEEYGEAKKELGLALKKYNKKENYFKALRPGEGVTIN